MRGRPFSRQLCRADFAAGAAGRTLSVMRTAVSLLLIAMLCGCSNRQYQADPLDEAPADFAIDLAVLAGPEAAMAAPDAEIHRRPARYVLFADGSLHSGVTDPHAPDSLPGRTRHLNSGDRAILWSLLQQQGLAEPVPSEAGTNLRLVTPQPDEIIYIVKFTGNGRQWGLTRRNGAAEPTDPAMQQLVRRMAQLSFASDAPEEQAGFIPPRYDFGPDPYARYRN